MKPGQLNLITDIAGLKVGNAADQRLKSGVTVLTAERPFTAAVHVMGGAPGTRETDLLSPDRLVQEVDALVLSGGSAFGLDACSGVSDGLRAAGRGFAVGDQCVPIVPGAILFDLLNGGAKDWRENPYRLLGRQALNDAATQFEMGTKGAGTGSIDPRTERRTGISLCRSGRRNDRWRTGGRQCAGIGNGGRRTRILGGTMGIGRRVWRAWHGKAVLARLGASADEGSGRSDDHRDRCNRRSPYAG
jgi:L-aminopeptidase/D-esterase-like protein